MPRIDLDAYEDDWEDAERPIVPRNRKLSVAARRRMDDLGSGKVVAVDRGRVTITQDGRTVDAVLGGTMRGTKAVVGDHVRLRGDSGSTTGIRVVEVLPRETELMRTGEDTRDDVRVLVANADQVIVVVAADHLDTGVRFLDRVMVAASVGGLRTALCVNKIDLVDDLGPVHHAIDDYAKIGVEGVLTSAQQGSGIDTLEALVAGKWSAFAGHSGVGKSSLFNLLAPQASQEVAEIGRYGGRHTTVASRAWHIAGHNAWIVDTPGVRSFGLGMLDARDLRHHMPELARLQCQLDDCLHDGEPGCTLDNAVISPARLAAYRRLLAALQEST